MVSVVSMVCCPFKFLDNTIARFLSKSFTPMELSDGVETARWNVRPLADPGWGWLAKPARVSSSIVYKGDQKWSWYSQSGTTWTLHSHPPPLFVQVTGGWSAGSSQLPTNTLETERAVNVLYSSYPDAASWPSLEYLRLQQIQYPYPPLRAPRLHHLPLPSQRAL